MLNHLTDHYLRHIRVDAVLPGQEESFADLSERTARLRARVSAIRIGWALVTGRQACARFDLAHPGTLAESQAACCQRPARR